jgi:alpha-galactosidase
MKIVFIGAGSFRFTYDLLRNLAAFSRIIPIEVWLVDIDAPLLETVTRIFKRISTKAGLSQNLHIHSSTDRDEALEGADTVIISISIGKQASEFIDIHIPYKFGIPHTTGDTCGPGGIMRAMRSIPEIIAIIKDIGKLCPDALVLNYTNPMSFITLAANQAVPRVVTTGICHELLAGMPVVHELFKKAGIKDIPRWESLDIEHSGINHFAWLLSIKHNGNDLYPVLKENAEMGIKGSKRPASFMLMKRYGYFPYPGSRHVLEFMPEYYNFFNAEAVWKAYNKSLIRNIQSLIQYEGIPKLRSVKLLERQRKTVIAGFKAVAAGLFPAPGPTFKGERVVEMIADRMASRAGLQSETLRRYHPVNVLNTGKTVVTNLPENCAVETAGWFENGIIETKKGTVLPEALLALIKPFAENQQRVVDAAITGDIEKLYEAFVNDPVCAFIEDEDAIRDMVLNMLHYEKQWLPQFRENLEKAGRQRRTITSEDIDASKLKTVKYPPGPRISAKAVFPL